MRIMLVLLMLVILFTELSLAQAITDDMKNRILKVYHEAIRERVGGTVSNQQIDDVLSLIINNPNNYKTSHYPLEANCQPRLHIVNADEIKAGLHQKSQRIQSHAGDLTVVGCFTLHKCIKHGGCCLKGDCRVKKEQPVIFDVEVHNQLTGESFIEQLEMMNQTECSCQAPIQECVCFPPYTSVMSQSNMSCDCVCPIDNEECNSLKSGNTRLDVNKSQIWSPTDYKDCLYHSLRDSYNEFGVYCPLPSCNLGLHFDAEDLRCKLKDISSTRRFEPTLSTVTQPVLNSPTYPQSNTELLDLQAAEHSTSSESLRTEKSKTTYRLDRIEQEFQYINGRVPNKVSRRLLRGIFKNRFREPVIDDSCLNGTFRYKVRKEIYLKCNSINKKGKPYFTYDLDKHFYFCSVDDPT